MEALVFRDEDKAWRWKEKSLGEWGMMPWKVILGETTSWFPREIPRQEGHRTQRWLDLVTETASLWRSCEGTGDKWERHRETWYQRHSMCNREREEACVELIRTQEKLQRDWGQWAVCRVNLNKNLNWEFRQQIKGLRLREGDGECPQTGKEKGK